MTQRLTDEQRQFLDDLVRRTSDMLLKYAYRYFHSYKHYEYMAEDAVQDVYLRAIRCVDTLMTHENPIGWLKVTLVHVLKDKKRKAYIQRELITEDVVLNSHCNRQAALEAIDRWSLKERLDAVMEAVAKVLTEDEQSTFRDHFLMGYSMEETSQRENISWYAARSRIERSRKKLKKYFGLLSLFAILIRYIG